MDDLSMSREVGEKVYALQMRIKTAKEALDVARKNPQDTPNNRRCLDRLIALHREHVVSAQDEIKNLGGPTCDEEAFIRDQGGENLLKCLTSLAESIERAEVSAKTGLELDTDSLLI